MKQQLKTKILTLLLCVSMMIAKTGLGQIATPTIVTTLPNNSSFQSNITLSNSEQWFKFTTDSIHVSVKVKLEEQGLLNSLSKVELFKDAGGGLIQIVFTDTLRTDSTMWVSATFLNPTTNIYLRVSSITKSCETCTGNNYPKISMDVMALQAGCNTYIQPPCQYVKDTSFEYATLPCAAIINPNVGPCNNDPYVGFANCFWNMPLANTFVNCGGLGSLASLGTSDYYCNGGHTGSGYAGIYLYTQTNPTPTTYGENNYREYITETLFTPLTTGKTYSLTIWVKRNPAKSFATSNIEVALSNGIYTQTSYNAIVSPAGQIIPMTSSVITSTNWTKLTTVFTANGNYSQITIGNFTGVGSSIVSNENPSINITADRAAYYYVDDISIRETFSISVTNPVCLGLGTATINVVPSNAGSTYTWTSSPSTPTLITVSGSSVVVSPTVTTNYTVSTTNALGCIMSNTVDVLTTPITFTASSYTFCASSGIPSITITASGLTTYSWVPHPTITGSLNSPTITVSPTTTTTYTVFGNLTGCPNTYSSTVTIKDISPTISISSSSIICIGTTVTVTTNSTATFSYVDFDAPGGVIFGTSINPYTSVYTYNSVGTYSIIAQSNDNINGCGSDYLIFPVTVVPALNPTLTISSSQTICAGQSKTLTVSGATSYTWSTGATTNSIVVSPTSNTTYTVTGATTCGTTTTAQVTVIIAPKPTLTANPSTICAGSTTTLTASGATSYTWNPGNLTGTTVTFTPAVTTTYTLTGNNGICSNTQTVTVTVNPKPTVGITAPQTTCAGTTVTLTATTGLTSYTWMPCSAACNTNTLAAVVATGANIFTVNVTGANGCTNKAIKNVIAYSNPVLSVNSATVCSGSSAILTATASTGTYSWSTGATTNTIVVSPTVTTNHSVTATNSQGCNTTVISTVVVTPNLPGVLSILSNTTLPIIANGTGTNVAGFSSSITNTTGITFNWQPSGATTPTTNFNITQSQVISLTLNNAACGSTLTQSVCVNYVAAICANSYSQLDGTLTNVNLNNLTYKVAANNTITINGSVYVAGCTFLMGTNSAIVVNAGASLIFNDSKIYSCDGMWYGIKTLYNTTSVGNIEIRNTTIEDAYKAVDADNTLNTIIPWVFANGGSIFNKNYIDFSLDNASVQIGNNTSFYIEHSNLISQASATSPGTNLKCSGYYAPTIKARSFAGVYANNAAAISFTSNPAFGNNTIKNKDYGLYFNKTNADVYNVNFMDIEGYQGSPSCVFGGGCTTPLPIGVAIFSANAPKALNVKPATGSTVNAYFSNVGYGILAIKTPTVDVQYCNFDNSMQTLGLNTSIGNTAIYTLDNAGAVRINKNTINSTYTGVSINYSVATTGAWHLLSVGQNTISAGTGTLNTGIDIVAALTSTFSGAVANEVIAANTITNAVRTGIRITNVKGKFRISGNTITLTSANGTKDGIFLNGGNNNVLVDNNTIDGNLTSTAATFNVNSCGIRSLNSAGCKIQCNTIKQIGKGIEYSGGNSSPGDGFFKNTLQFPMRRGLVLSNGGLIGTQGSNTGTVTGASANVWAGSWPAANSAEPQQTFVGGPLPSSVASDAANSPLWVRNTGAELPGDNYYTSPSILNQIYSTGLGSLITFTTTVSDYSTCPTMLTQGAKVTVTSSGVNSMEDRDADFVKYITTLLPADSMILTPQDKYMLKQYMFNDLTQTSSANATLLSFYNQLKNTAIEAYSVIDDLLASGNSSLANSKNAQAGTANDINQTQHDFNTLYINGINNQSDFDQLNYLTKLCPNQYGNAVFQARALLQILTYQYVEYSDSCYTDKLNGRFGYSDKTENGVSVTGGVIAKLYPNPNNGTFMLAYDLKTNYKAEVQIMDISGKLVYSNTIDNLSSLLQVNTINLQSGMYFIQLVNDKTLLWTDKVMISK